MSSWRGVTFPTPSHIPFFSLSLSPQAEIEKVPFLQALRMLNQASRSGLDKARQQLQLANAALIEAQANAASFSDVSAPAMFPNLYRMHLCCPTASVTPLTIADAHSHIESMIACLTEMCALRFMEEFASVVRLAEHISVTWDSALCRGVLHNLLQPPGVDVDEEMPDWAPTARKFVQQLHLPLARTQVCDRLCSLSPPLLPCTVSSSVCTILMICHGRIHGRKCVCGWQILRAAIHACLHV
jgi:hypothetical protein